MGGAPSDLAAMIAAKAASRKPMATSPTRKDFPTSTSGGGGGGLVDRDARLIRSSTMGRDGSISDARYVEFTLGLRLFVGTNFSGFRK